MIANWTTWKPYPNAARGESIEAPIGPGLYEVRDVASDALFACGATENVALELAQLGARPASWFTRKKPVQLPALEYRTCATTSFTAAKAAAAHLFDRRGTYLRGAA